MSSAPVKEMGADIFIIFIYCRQAREKNKLKGCIWGTEMSFRFKQRMEGYKEVRQIAR